LGNESIAIHHCTLCAKARNPVRFLDSKTYIAIGDSKRDSRLSAGARNVRL
jgi:hypothetical protein